MTDASTVTDASRGHFPAISPKPLAVSQARQSAATVFTADGFEAAAVTAGGAMVVSSFHTLWVNRRFLPKPLQPSRAREVGLALCGLFYLVMTSLAVYGKVMESLGKA